MTEPKLNKIISWTKNYAQENNIKTLIIPFSGGYNSALVTLIAKNTNLNVKGILSRKARIHQSTEDKFEHNLLKNLTDFLDLELEIIDPQIEITFAEAFVWAFQLASTEQGLVLGTVNKTKFLTRHYRKHEDGEADIFPILGLFEDEVRQLINQYIDVPLIDDIRKHEDYLNLTYDEIKWASHENDKYNIIQQDDKPQNFEKWYKYTKRQKEVISNIYQRYNLTKHKDITHKPHII